MTRTRHDDDRQTNVPREREREGARPNDGEEDDERMILGIQWIAVTRERQNGTKWGEKENRKEEAVGCYWRMEVCAPRLQTRGVGVSRADEKGKERTKVEEKEEDQEKGGALQRLGTARATREPFTWNRYC